METRIKYIAHTADIHIGHPGREDEYLAVFERFARSLPPAAETLVVIAGDIFHHKTRYSGVDVHLFNRFMELLGDYSVIIIPGNHDTNMNNLQMMDLITPVMGRGHFPNVHYWKYTGDYALCGIKFYHVSVFGTLAEDAREIPPLTTAGLIERGARDTILLYHGMVNGVVYGTQVASERLITREVMAKFGAVMLGDIHQQQHLLPTAAYPGSLIQQNVAESQDKGYLLWDMSSWPAELSSKPIWIPNDSGFVKLDFRGMSAEEIKELIESRPLHDKMLKVSVLTDESAPADHLAAVEAKFGRIDVIKKSAADSVSAAVVGDTLRALLIAGGMDEQSTETCVADYVSQIVTVARGHWYITRVEWDNLFKYGPGNVIDFTKLSSHNGISGVIAGNHRGKSSIFDIIAFGLFNEHLRGKSVQDIIRKEANSSRVSVEIITCGTSWKVVRTDSRGRHTDLKLYRKDIAADGSVQWVNCTSETANGTYQQIARLIGTFTQLMATGMYYDVGYELTRKKPADCLTMMTGLIGLDCNEKISAALDDNISRINKQITGLVKPRVKDDSEVRRLEDTISSETAAQEIDESALRESSARLTAYQNKLSGIPLETLNLDITELSQRIEDTSAQIATLDADLIPVDKTEWRAEWETPPTLTAAQKSAGKRILADHGNLAQLEKYIAQMAVDTAAKVATADTLKSQVKSRGNPASVNKIPSLRAEIEKLTNEANQDISLPSVCAGISREAAMAELSRLMDIISDNKPLPIDNTAETTLTRNIQLVDADMDKLQTAANLTLARGKDKINDILAKLEHEYDVSTLTIKKELADSAVAALSAELSNVKSRMKTAEYDALLLHIQNLKSKSGLDYADGCAACMKNKSTFCDGLIAAETTLNDLRTHNISLSAHIDSLRGKIAAESDNVKSLETKISLMNELEAARAAYTRTTDAIASQTADLQGRREEWEKTLAEYRQKTLEAAEENKLRDLRAKDALAEKERMVRVVQAYDAWDAKCRSVSLAQTSLEKLTVELASIESLLELVKQYGVASAAAKDASALLDSLKQDFEIAKMYESATEYEKYSRWRVYTAKMEAREKLSGSLAEMCTKYDYVVGNSADILCLQMELSEVERLRRVITDRAVAIGIARRDLSRANEELSILREYEREYPVLRDKLEMYKKYRAVVKSGGLKAGVVGRYLDIIIGRANDMLKTVSAGFSLTCSVDSNGVSFSFREGARELSLALASGFQRFISALTFRMALISVLPASPSFMMIDEGFGCMDDTNLIHAIEFLETCVLRDYEFVFVISHKEELRNTIRSPLCISGDAVSYLNNTAVIVPPKPEETPAAVVAAPAAAPVDQPAVAADRVQCECGALVLKKSLRAHLNTARHRNGKK